VQFHVLFNERDASWVILANWHQAGGAPWHHVSSIILQMSISIRWFQGELATIDEYVIAELQAKCILRQIKGEENYLGSI